MTDPKLGNLVVIDDDESTRVLLTDFLTKLNYSVRSFDRAEGAIPLLAKETEGVGEGVDLIICDIQLPGMSGIDFASQIKEQDAHIPVILATAFASIKTAVEGMRKGVYDYAVKPFDFDQLHASIERALRYRRVQKENVVLRNEVKGAWSKRGVIGKSPAMRSMFDLIERVSDSNANVLITGESGTGKEVVARAIHEGGPRVNKPFIAINCAAIPENLLESELFGHAKGAFTGAMQRKRGLFEEAHGGTLFLDEIGDLPLALQSKFLRVLQDRKIRAVGDTVDKEIDVRLISATHQDLKAAISEKTFREDLFYRLSVIPVAIPPLRARTEDIPLLAAHFLKGFSATNGKEVTGFSQKAMDKLVHARWPGNIRELQNIIERAVVLCRKSIIDEEDLPSLDATTAKDFLTQALDSFPSLEEMEKQYIKLVLEKSRWNKTRASEILRINRRTLYRKDDQYHLGIKEHPISSE